MVAPRRRMAHRPRGHRPPWGEGATLYAYVSRGLIRRERVAGTRTSRYSRADVERLAAKGRRTSDGPGPEIVVDSAITLIDPAGHLYYRGWDAARAAVGARTRRWRPGCGTPPNDEWLALRALRWAGGRRPPSPRPRPSPIGSGWSPRAVGPCDPLRHDRRPPSVAARAAARSLRPWSSVAARRSARPVAGSIARSIVVPRLTARAATPARIKALNATLVLLADHELATSTLAVRVAASTWADPYLLLRAGLARPAVRCTAARRSSSARSSATRWHRSPSRGRASPPRRAAVPGFGHSVYEGPDPRAPVLLDAVDRPAPTELCARRPGVLDVVARADGPHPNVDFALGVLAEANRMVPGPAKRSSPSPAARAGLPMAWRSTSTGSATGSGPPTPAQESRVRHVAAPDAVG